MDLSTLTNDPEGIVEADRAHVWHHLSQHKPYTAGVDKRIGDAIAAQVTKMCFFGGSAGTIPGATFSEMLTDKMPGLDRVYYANSGSEANEKAFKMVRQISHKHHGGKKHKILFRERDYHGTTIATLSAGGQEERNAQYGPFTPGFVSVPHCLEYRSQDGSTGEAYAAASLKAIEDVILREGADTIGSLCLEPITAGGGIIVAPDGYWAGVQELCKKYEILLHIDEVVCGLGRTGTWFGYQQFGIQRSSRGNREHEDYRRRRPDGQLDRDGRTPEEPLERAVRKARLDRPSARHGPVRRGRACQRPQVERAC